MKRWYQAHVHQLRSLIAFLAVAAGQVIQAGPDAMATWTVRRWIVGILVAVGSGALPLLMRAGEFNPPQLTQLDPPK